MNPTLAQLQDAIDVLNAKYPRPGMDSVQLSLRFDLRKDWPNKWPGADNPGVYVFLGEDMTVLYIGKASCGHCLGRRLGSYFMYGADRSAKEKDAKARDVFFVATIAVPEERAFEAAAIEEYLIGQVRPPRNKLGI